MKTNITEITKDDFKEALEKVFNDEITTIAPFGMSTGHIYLYNNPTPKEEPETGFIGWSCCVTLRAWSDMPELLIGNKSGDWLCHLKISRCMGFDYILDEFYRQFENVKDLIECFANEELKVKFSKDMKETNWLEASKQLAKLDSLI